MFRLTAVYPAKEGARFDWDYYKTRHFDLVRETCAPHGLVGAGAVQCVPGPDGSPAPYVAVATIDFESAEKFAAGFPVAAPILMGDIPNFTDIQPVITVGPVHS
ncbi:MAG: EthD family reductase [Planctomycetes bacterium]|nr:EthD family reductase [Planctomycetota bacterium]